MNKIPNGIYEHYKGKQYEVLGIVHHSETVEPLVLYKALYEIPQFGKDSLWVRPLKIFTENVMVNGKETPRFKFVRKK
ncbi:MAG: hypothetical protein A2Z88_10435 [Omnitrophica WOR_2 bacterium GWA2_47_8]|nr:MAG: hypothetical protein A2Z88_10435 [Omnitrophica WOR_2 bacterium GWA2_47_8]